MSDQSYYWAPEWQEGERRATEDVAAGRMVDYESAVNMTVGQLTRMLAGLGEDLPVLMQAVMGDRETFIQPVFSARIGTHPQTQRRCAVLLVNWTLESQVAPSPKPLAMPMTTVQAIQAIADVVGEVVNRYRRIRKHDEYVIAARVLDVLEWPTE